MTVPDVSWAGAGYLAAIPFEVAAILVFPGRELHRAGWGRAGCRPRSSW